jgi:hypothetical protein
MPRRAITASLLIVFFGVDLCARINAVFFVVRGAPRAAIFFPLTVLGDLALGTFRQKIQKSQSGGSFFVCKKNDSAVQQFGGGGCM